MTLTILVSGAALFLRAAVLMRRDAVWLRRSAIMYLLLAAVSDIVLGFSNVARFGMIDDVGLLRSQAKYVDAYRAGLLAAQEVANRYTPTTFILFVCLAVLAWIPEKKEQSGH